MSASTIRVIDGVEKKLCTRRDSCLHPAGPLLPMSEFYDYRDQGEGVVPRCKVCHSEHNKMLHRLRMRAKASEKIEFMKTIAVAQRAGSVFALIRDGQLSAAEFQQVLRHVEF